VVSESNSFVGDILTVGQKMTRRSVAWGILSLILLGSSLAFVYNRPGAKPAGASVAAAADSENARLLSVRTEQLSQFVPESLSLEYTGVVQARRRSLLAAKEIGRVDAVHFDIGDRVAAGELLVELDQAQVSAQHRAAKASLDAAKARYAELQAGPREQEKQQARSGVAEVQSNLKLAEANWTRLKDLRATGAASQQELDEANFRKQALEAQLASAKQQLDLLEDGTRAEQLQAQSDLVASLGATEEQLRVRLNEKSLLAPYDCHIQDRRVDEGDVVSPGQVLLEVVEEGQLEIHVGLPNEHADELILQRTCRVGSISPTGEFRPIAVELERIAPVLDSVTRTRRCVFRVVEDGKSSSAAPETSSPNRKETLAIGDSVQVRLTDLGAESSEEFLPWVHKDALIAGPRGLWGVFVTEPEAESFKVSQRPVEVLRVKGDWAQIRGDVTLGDAYVTTGTHRIVSGQLVELED
ncbi:MAG: HlyD family efflux transporter periplasmic adaptor subunit, partial [Planctomycetota bacterium]